MQKIEIWKNIKGYEGLYMASNKGNICSFRRTGGKDKKILKGGINTFGYRFVVLVNSNKQKKSFLISRLVCSTFHDNIFNYPCVNHKDGNKLNNASDNLEWCTYQQNTNHAIDNNLMDWNHPCKGEKHGRHKLIKKDVIKIKRLLKHHVNISYLSKLFNVSPATIWLIKTGKNWHSVK